jgi:hypothetical protein
MMISPVVSRRFWVLLFTPVPDVRPAFKGGQPNQAAAGVASGLPEPATPEGPGATPGGPGPGSPCTLSCGGGDSRKK